MEARLFYYKEEFGFSILFDFEKPHGWKRMYILNIHILFWELEIKF
jgi:hypothetical protein